MPVYNAAEYLAESLASIQNQSYQNWQMLIINDGSTDDSLSIIQQFANSDHRFEYRSQSNQGLVRTLNALVEWSTAPLLARMDADDISEPLRFEKQLDFMQRHPDIDMVGCWIKLFGDKDEIWHFRESDNNTRILSLFGKCCMTHASVMAKRAVFEAVPYEVKHEHMEDLVFLSRLITQTSFRFGNVREVLYHYRMHIDSIVHSYEIKRKLTYEKLLSQHFDALNLSLSEQEYMDYWQFLRHEKVNHETAIRIGQLLHRIRSQLAATMPDEHHEIPLRWWKYCQANEMLELYPICQAENYCFLCQHPNEFKVEHLHPIDIAAVNELSNSEWVLLGSGGFAHKLLRRCIDLGVPLPKWIVGDNTKLSETFGVRLVPESEAKFGPDQRIVIGSDVHQMSIAKRFAPVLPHNSILYDCSSDLYSESNITMFKPASQSHDAAQILIVDVNPNEHVNGWLRNMINAFHRYGVGVRILHPLQYISDSALSCFMHIYLWNGTKDVFSPIKKRIKCLGLKFDFLECGFFPQRDYFYVDPMGINNERHLSTDTLEWVTADMFQKKEQLKHRFFEHTGKVDEGYVFVPLQLANDSNVQCNSRFRQGMQEFIDFIEQQYPEQRVIFKKHPKDPLNYQSIKGEFSLLDSRTLILGATCVHGINSTVLFEAALAGKKVIAEGQCLLNHFSADVQTVIAAMIARQHAITDNFDWLVEKQLDRIHTPVSLSN